jgi:hypothetical protein
MSTDFLAGAMARRAAALCALRKAGPVVEDGGIYGQAAFDVMVVAAAWRWCER